MTERVDDVPRALPRFRAHLERIDDERKIAALVLDDDSAVDVVMPTVAGGDAVRLRGIPVIGRGVGGAISGTRP